VFLCYRGLYRASLNRNKTPQPTPPGPPAVHAVPLSCLSFESIPFPLFLSQPSIHYPFPSSYPRRRSLCPCFRIEIEHKLQINVHTFLNSTKSERTPPFVASIVCLQDVHPHDIDDKVNKTKNNDKVDKKNEYILTPTIIIPLLGQPESRCNWAALRLDISGRRRAMGLRRVRPEGGGGGGGAP
jgi:hypothetical protein